MSSVSQTFVKIFIIILFIIARQITKFAQHTKFKASK